MKSIDQGEGVYHPIPETEIIINLLPVLLFIKAKAQPIKLARNGNGLGIA